MADEEKGIIDPVTGGEVPKPEQVEAPTEEPEEETQTHDAVAEEPEADGAE